MSIKEIKTLEEDEYLKLDLIHYKNLGEWQIFEFSSLSFLQLLRHFPNNEQIVEFSFHIEEENGDFFTNKDININFKCIGDIFSYFLKRKKYEITNCHLVLFNSIKISFDEGFVNIFFPMNYNFKEILFSLFEYHGFDYDKIINLLIKDFNKYIEVEKPGVVIDFYSNYDEYIDKRL